MEIRLLLLLPRTLLRQNSQTRRPWSCPRAWKHVERVASEETTRNAIAPPLSACAALKHQHHQVSVTEIQKDSQETCALVL